MQEKNIADYAFILMRKKWPIEKIEEHLSWFNSFEISDKNCFNHLKYSDFLKGKPVIPFSDNCGC